MRRSKRELWIRLVKVVTIVSKRNEGTSITNTRYAPVKVSYRRLALHSSLVGNCRLQR